MADKGGTLNLPLSGVVTYTIVLSNSGGGTATGVIMTDSLPAEVSYGTWIAQNGAQEADNIISWVGVISAGNEVQLTFTAIVSSGTVLWGQTITNTARFISSNAGSKSDTVAFKVIDESGAGNQIYLPLVLK